MATNVYSHIIDEDTRKKAELFEEAFYGKENLNPQMVDAGEGKMITVPDGVDAETLAKVLANRRNPFFSTAPGTGRLLG